MAAGLGAVRQAARELSDAYREGKPPRLDSEQAVAAYLATRMPATYAAAERVMREIGPYLADVRPTVLDVGAGPGAAALAAASSFPLGRITLIERDPTIVEASKQFLPAAEVRIQDFTRTLSLPPHDLVIAAYSLGETTSPDIALRLWEAARLALVVIEPGSRRGFAFIREIRGLLLKGGAHMMAPCPGTGDCPMREPDWCHFGARVERSALHRRLKEAELNYEDEKFSYLAVSRRPVELPAARILRRPQHQPGLILVETCTPGGLESRRVTRRDRPAFRAARQAGWGGTWRPL